MMQIQTNNAVTARSVENRAPNPGKKPGQKDGKEFNGTLAEANAAVLAAQPQPILIQSAPLTAQAPQEGQKSETKGAEATAQRGAEQSKAVYATKGEMIEKIPEMQKSAASLTTGAAITGLKPWSSDWVFEGGFEKNPKLQTLFQSDSKAAQDLSQAIGGEAQATLQKIAKDAEASQRTLGVENAYHADSNASEPLTKLGVTAAAVEVTGIQAPVKSQPLTASGPAGTMSGSDFVNTLAIGASGAAASGRAGVDQNPQQGFGGGQSGQNPFGQSQNPSVISTQEHVQGQGFSVKTKKPLEIDSGKDALTAGSLGSHAPNVGHRVGEGQTWMGGGLVAKEVTGHVVKGTMAQDRLSTESLTGMAGGIRNMTAQGGGEMRIRLRPENLGELHVRVVTSGKDVGLSIQASDEKAKKILEESIGSLKDSLASQNLSLGKVDFSVGQTASSGRDQQMNSQHQPGSQGFSDAMGQNANQSQQNKQEWGSAEAAAFSRPAALRTQGTSGSSASSGSRTTARAAGTGMGRIDVTA